MAPTDPIGVDLSGIINLPAASFDTDGLVELATPDETQEGTDDTVAVTPAGAAATYLAIDELSAKGDLLTAIGPSQPLTLPVGSNGQILTACSLCQTGLTWESPLPAPPPSIPCSCVTEKGVILTGSSPQVPAALPVGSNGQVLTACSLCQTGLAWVTLPPSPPPSIPCACITGKGSILTGSDSQTPTALPVGLNGQVIRANSCCPTGLEWSNVGKTASVVANAGIVAIAMDDLRVCFTTTGNRTWAFSVAEGSATVAVQTVCSMLFAISGQRRAVTLSSTAFTDFGWNFNTCSGSCATYVISYCSANYPLAYYCFTGVVGANYNNNLFHITRLF